jgi:voltage-gated potassium channel
MPKKNVIYEIIMMFLSFIVVMIVIIQLSFQMPVGTNNILTAVDFTIWMIFIGDYLIRLISSEDKKKFILNNKIDLITILPFSSLFRTLRVLRVGKLLKLLKLTRGLLFFTRFTTKLERFIKTNNFNYVLIATIVTIFAGAGLISIVENMSFSDSIWWSFVTVTTVGYGDLSPATNIGRIVASILMLVGIGFIGMLTGTISTYFLSRRKDANKSYKEDILESIKVKLDDFDNISKEDIYNIYHVMLSLKQDDVNTDKKERVS